MAGDVLPFVLEHGAWVSRTALALVVATPIAVGLLVGRRNARKRIREKVRAMERHADHVRGTLRGGSILSLHAKAREYANLMPADVGPSEIVVTHTTGDVWLDTKDGRVNLEGPLELVAGSLVHVSEKGVPTEVPAELLAAAREKAKWVHRPGEAGTYAIGTATLRILRQGDEIIATGLVESVASKTPDTAGYRDNAASMEIRAVSDESPIRLAARIPRAERAPLRVFPLFLVSLTLFGIGYGVSRNLGEHWMKKCNGPYADGAPIPVSNTQACSLAAATWGREREAKQELLWRLDRAPQSALSRAQSLALSGQLEDCEAKIARRMRMYDYEGARKQARQCNDVRGEHIALIADGRFDEAVAVKVPSAEHLRALPSTETLVAAGRWADAVAAVDATLAKLQKDPPDENTPANIHYQQCLRELFSFYGGDVTALVRLRTLGENQELSSCDGMIYEHMTAEERAADGVSEYGGGDLRWSYGYAREPRFAAESAESSIAQPSEMGTGYSLHLLWLLDTNRDVVLKGPVGDNPHTHRWLAAARIYDGDAKAAFEAADRALAAFASAKREEEYELRDLPHLHAAIALRTPEIRAVNFENPPAISPRLLEMVRDNWAYDFGRLQLRSGKPLGNEDLQRYLPSEYREALNAATQGNGTLLARELSSARWWSPADVLAVWPHLKSGKEQILEALRYSNSSSLRAQIDYYYPFGLVGLAIDYRDAFRVAGATADAEVWDARYRRVDAVLSDRKKLIALMMLRGLD